MSESTVLYAEHGAVAVATLNRARSLNSFRRQMHHDLWAALERVEGVTVFLQKRPARFEGR